MASFTPGERTLDTHYIGGCVENPVVSGETVMYGYESSATLTTDRLHYKLQIRPLVRESAPRQRVKQFSGKTKGKSKIWSWAPKGCPTPRYTD
jgi:hypothetical protein